jgi:hypothetical protein
MKRAQEIAMNKLGKHDYLLGVGLVLVGIGTSMIESIPVGILTVGISLSVLSIARMVFNRFSLDFSPDEE